MPTAQEVLSKLISQLSESDREEICVEANVDNLEKLVASIPNGNMAVKLPPAVMGALLRRIDPTDEQISQLVEGGIFEIGFDLLDEADFEVIVRFDSPRSRHGALPLTDIAVASLAMNALLKSIVTAHRPLGVDLEIPLVVVFTGSLDVTPKCKRAIGLGLMLVIGLGETADKGVGPIIKVIQSYKESQARIHKTEAETKATEEVVKTEQENQALKKKEGLLLDSQIGESKSRKAREEREEEDARGDAALKNALRQFVEANTPKNVESKLPADPWVMEPLGNALGDAGQTSEHPASFDVSNDLTNELAHDLIVDPAYIAHLLNRTFPAYKLVLSGLGDLTVTLSVVPKEKR